MNNFSQLYPFALQGFHAALNITLSVCKVHSINDMSQVVFVETCHYIQGALSMDKGGD